MARPGGTEKDIVVIFYVPLHHYPSAVYWVGEYVCQIARHCLRAYRRLSGR